MKYLHVSFLPNQYWKFFWATGLLITAAFAVPWVLRVTVRISELALAEKAFANTTLVAGNRLPNQQIRQESAADTLSAQLKLSLGPLLTAAEAPLPSGVKLVGLTFANNPGTARLEYQLPVSSQVRLVADALNGGYNVPPWKLSNVIGVAMTVPNSASGDSTVVRAAWETTLRSL